jgi:hypothetical protein
VEEAAVLSYVGVGGNWQSETTYKYVGGGAGNFEMVMVPTKWYSNLWFLLLAIPLVLLLLWKGSETTTTTAADLGPPKICTIFGDPHLQSFDGTHSDYFTPGEYYIVKSKRVIIQGRYLATPMTHGLAVTKEVAISGAFINNHRLIIGSLTATFDGKAIMTTFPASESYAGIVRIEYNAQGDVLQKGRAGKQLHVVHVYLPDGIIIQINRWNEPGEGDYINVKITMPHEPGMDGECGNFNGNPADDERTAVRARLGKQGVPAGELLFPGPKTPIVQSDRPQLADCKQKVLDHADELCKEREHTTFPSNACLLDVCFGGDMFAGEDVM